MKTVNDLVALEPFEDNHNKSVTISGIALLQQFHELVKLKVVFAPSDGSLSEGQSVFVRADIKKNAFALQVYSKDEKRFILVPKSMLVGVE